MATKLFIGKLSFNTTEASLRTLFEQYGVITSCQVIKEHGTEQSKGFAFVEMESAEAAQAAINALDGQDFEGRSLVVNVARPREDRPQSRGFNSGFQRR
ncbi:MAG TPA: RNA-binding protein [Bacillota bacterium]|nr:RNA-binding protein [Bacillota bacterium]